VTETIQLREKFIAYIDILGFRSILRNTELGIGISMQDILNAVKLLGGEDDRERHIKYGPRICPGSRFVRKDLDFQITQISDCAIVSVEISPAGIIDLVSHCWRAVLELMAQGIMCRGYITRGMIYHTKEQVIGSGYINAFERERQVAAFKQGADERGTPFVEVDPDVVQYVAANGDRCIAKMFSRMTESDGSLTAIFPFKRLKHKFMVAGFGVTFDAAKHKASNQILRELIKEFKANIVKRVDCSNADANQKSQQYIRALDVQLAQCDETDVSIDRWVGLGARKRGV
jgi:hypothetical protein